jgi:signal transduction histidine kinase
LNLYSNAIKFTECNGKVYISIVKKSDSQGNETLTIQVTDNGVGIQRKDYNNLFKLFSSIRDERRKINMNGIGLGLVISKLIVSKFNGVIDFFSKFKHGSTFFFTFEIYKISVNEIKIEKKINCTSR